MLNIRGTAIATLLLALVAQSVSAQVPGAKLPQAATTDRVEKIEALLRAARSREQFNGTIQVSECGHIIYRKAFGYADFEKKTPLRADSVFELASVSKPFTALAVMMLKERGKLSYNDQLDKYFPELPYRNVTVRHLLTHTAGLPDAWPFFGSEWATTKTVTNADFVARLAQRKTPALFAPGEKWQYGGTAYLLLARIVEVVSNVSYDRFLEDNVFRPTGMKDSFVINRRNRPKWRRPLGATPVRPCGRMHTCCRKPYPA